MIGMVFVRVFVTKPSPIMDGAGCAGIEVRFHPRGTFERVSKCALIPDLPLESAFHSLSRPIAAPPAVS
jgi:hypothetical protein